MSEKISELKTLLTRLMDSSDGYKQAAEKATQERHVNMFTDLSAERYNAALKVQEHLKRHGENVDLDGSLLAATHRFFMDLRNKLDDGDEAIMEYIVSGESELLECYRNAMEDAQHDPEFLKTLQEQYKKAEANLELIHAKAKAA
tara:strand:- start:713 stop:1147 length:435 start_codon:yes stop_codon:yes gene_type:complete